MAAVTDLHVNLIGKRDLSGEIYRQLREAVREGRVRPGDRLPPTEGPRPQSSGLPHDRDRRLRAAQSERLRMTDLRREPPKARQQ
jgi:hypothetical protein